MSGLGKAGLLLKRALGSTLGDQPKKMSASSDDSSKKSKWGETNKKISATTFLGKTMIYILTCVFLIHPSVHTPCSMWYLSVLVGFVTSCKLL